MMKNRSKIDKMSKLQEWEAVWEHR